MTAGFKFNIKQIKILLASKIIVALSQKVY